MKKMSISILRRWLSVTPKNNRRILPNDGITLSKFLVSENSDLDVVNDSEMHALHYLDNVSTTKGIQSSIKEQKLTFHIQTYGCQMNSNDSDIVRSLLLNHVRNNRSNFTFEELEDANAADIVLLNTCAIRDNAESKVWHRITELKNINSKSKNNRSQVVGVLGCMAERLKDDMFSTGHVDLVAGPDAYRDLPRLISSVFYPSRENNNEQIDIDGDSLSEDDTKNRVINVQLSIDETYADVTPVRKFKDDVSAFVSVMRGCNNMCSYCVVPFTRGRERSRELGTIVEESRRLYEVEGVKEICLLGQNVNSYHDKSDLALEANPVPKSDYSTSNDGFTNMFRLRGGGGYYFADLLDEVSLISPELRVRFTSPHPKDYPKDLLHLMAERNNICNQLHMPAQSGSTTVLERMRRGYSREAYLELIEEVKQTIPDVAISSDFISGFCGETDDEHRDTLSLMTQVVFDQAFMFAYSMRGKTHAHRKMLDDIPEDVKGRRLREVIDTFHAEVQKKNDISEVGKIRIVLVEGHSRRSSADAPQLNGRTDQNKRIYFPEEDCLIRMPVAFNANDMLDARAPLKRGDYAAVLVTEARGHTLRGKALWRTTLSDFFSINSSQLNNSALDYSVSMESMLKMD